MVVSEGAINNIMGGMENTTGVRLHSHRHKLKQRFDIVRKLGQGTYGKVQLALNKETKQQVAIKTIKKAKIETEQDLVRIRREIQIMSSVQHPQIIHIYEVFENREKMVLVMEYAAGGELYDYLSERKVLPEEEARRIFRQVASAVYYCHKHKICHRDLKLENILLDSDGNAKIADFGLSNVFDEKQRLDTFCGSPLYASPEIVKGVPYVGPEVDCWSLGVLLYTLVYGAMPFDGSNFRRLVKQITQGDFYEPSTPANASDLIRQMLTVQSTERANIADICNHWWVNEGYSESCLTLAEYLANQTPVRLDLLLSLAPKHISSEHMLIQPEEEDISQKSDSERGPPDLKIPPPPALDDETQMEPVPLRSHSLGAVPPSGGVTVDLLLEKKKKEREKKKKDSTSKKPPSRPTNEEERKSKKKEEKVEEEKEKKKVKRVDSSSEREKEKIKKRDVSNDREKAKKRERSSEREKARKRDSSGDRAKIRKKDASDEDIKKDSEAIISKDEKGAMKKTDSSSSLKTSVKKENEEPVTTSKFSAKETKVEECKVPDGLSSTQIEESKPDVKEVPKTLSSKSISKSLSKSEASEKKSVTRKSDSKVGLVPEEEKDTEKILKETAAKIEKAESLIKKEGELVSPVSSSPLTSPVMSPPVTSPLASSQNSPFATSPVRSRTGSESSTEAGRQTKSESSSRRQSKIFSKAALFEPSLSHQHSKSPPPQIDKPKKITTRPGALNMSDLTKKFEDKSSTEKKNKVVTPFKVSDTRKAFESKVEKSVSETSKHKTSVSSIGEVGQSSSKDSLPASPTKGDKLLVNSLGTKVSTPMTVKVANKSSRETSPTKKLSKSPTKESPPKDVSSIKKEKSPKKESSPVKTVPKSVSKISSFSKAKEEAPKEKKIEPPSEEIISKGKESITTATKKASQTRIPPTAKFDTSDSSDSESEAEKMLRELSEKREKLEIAKKEKLKKVSEGKEAQISQNNTSIIRDDSTTTTPVALTSSSSVTSQPESRDQKYATLPRGFKSKTEQTTSQKPRIPLPKTSSIEESNSSEPIKKKSQVEIVLQSQNRQPTSPLDQGKRSSMVDIHPQPSRSQFRTEIQRSIGTPEPKGPPPEPQLQRARRERIIPIMLEDETATNEYNNKMATSSRSSMIQPSSSSSSRNSSVSSVPRTVGFGVTPLPVTVNSTAAAAERKMNPSPPEQIRKSRRERIIPIAVEGEGLITPPISESRSSEKVRPYQRQGSRGRGFTLDRAESFSSAGEDEEDEEDDGFQILTAESLFSTLLSRVRSLTRKMGEDSSRSSNIGSDRLKRGPLQPGLNSDTPSSAGSSGTQSGFWSSLYSPPRDLPARTIPISRGQSKEEDPFSGFGPPLWERSLSRNTSDSDSVFSEPSGPFSTLPRGWRARRSARDERLVEGDEGFASFTPSRRQFYSRTLSRDLPLKTSNEDLKRTGSRNSWDASTSSDTIPRTGTATGSAIPTQFNQESSNKLASKNSTSDSNTKMMRESNNNSILRERPLSAIGNTMSSGEAYGRVGGNYEQHRDKSSAFLKSDKDKQESNTGKQSVQQLKDLVSELESVTEENSDAFEKNNKSNVTFLTTNVKCPLQSPKPSKSFTSLQMQQHNLINQSNSNPNIVFSITISSPRNQQSLPKNMISSNSNYKETNKEEKNFINSHDDNQHDSISSKKTPKNTFTPYSPNSSSESKNAVFNKPTVNDTTLVRKEVQSEKAADKHLVPLEKINELEKPKDSELQSEKPAQNIKTGTNLPSYLKSNDTFKVENKHLLNVEPYRRGRSEDLRVAIDLANSSSSSTVDSGRSIKPYRKSKSRDITPTIEAASERFTQLNSGTLRKISPFEAYRRSKSKELSSSIDIVNNSTENRMKSPPPPPQPPPPTSESTIKPDSSMSQFEKAKTSIEKKFEKAKSPPIEVETTVKEVCHSPLLPQEAKDDTANESQKEKEKQCKEIKESDKPKSVYKILTTKFTRSLSNLGEDKQDKSQNKDNTEENDKEEKFKLKRPSIFMKTKMEKSSSKTSIAETEAKDDDTDKNDKKSNKLSYALNKFLGRKPEDTSSKINKNDTLIPPKKSTSVAIIPEKVKKPPRFRTKKFSKSQENLNHGNEDVELDHETRSKSVMPDSEETSEVMENHTASKDSSSHLSKIEIKITPTINNTLQSFDSKPKVTSPQNANYTPSISSYGLSPALINKRLSNAYSNSSDKDLSSYQTEPDIVSKKKLSDEYTEERSTTPTEYASSALEDIKEAEDESVMDRITRKSYYTRFNEMKRKPKPKRIDSRETMDQQLAAAKARLMQEESKEIASSSRMTPQRSFTSISPPLISNEVVRRTSKGTLPRTISLPPDDGYIGGSRNSPFSNQEENYKTARYQSSEREPVGFHRSNSITREEQRPYRRQLSTNLDEAYSNHKRLSSVGRDDPPFFLRQPSVPRDDDQPTFRLPSTVKDETPSYRRLSAALRDEPKLRDSSLTKDESFSYHKMPSTSLRETIKDKRQPSVPKESYGHRRSLSRDFGNSQKSNDTSTSINSPTNEFQYKNKDSGNTSENYEKSDVFAVANAAGKAAGEAAAAAAAVSPSQRIPSPLSNISASDPDAVKSAREELTRRLTPLTRLSSMGSGESRPYRRTVTSGNLPLNQFSTNKTTGLERPYRRTTTTDLPPLDSRIRTNEIRRFQEPSRRFSGIRSVENGIDSKPSPAMLSPSSRSPYYSYAMPTSSVSPFQSPPSMNTILRRSSLYRY